MELCTIQRVIPEHTETTTYYVSDDGKRFLDENSCLEYEKHQKFLNDVASHPVFKYSRETYLWLDEQYAKLYYIGSDSDYEFLLNHLNVSRWETNDYSKFGTPAFYFYICTDGGDGPDWHRLVCASQYIDLVKLEYNNWLKDICQSMESVREQREEDGLECVL